MRSKDRSIDIRIFQGTIVTTIALFLLCAAQLAMADGGRTDKPGPGADGVEVIAGTGYGHTLFDSATNKCQHCHNDLYDTWKTSMHAKSWSDPLFQAKYQDFLRLQASKIGTTKPNGTYTEKTIQKTSQVCIKCHAPGAYYSGDYKVSLNRIGDIETYGYDPDAAFAEAKSLESNLSSPPASKFNAANTATVASMGLNGQAYTISYHIGHGHNREGVNCAYCHSVETVRMMNDIDGDLGQYTLKGPIKMGPIGPVVRNPGDTLFYDPSAAEPDMNAFFALIGPEKYLDFGNTPKQAADFDIGKKADGRHTIKSIDTGCVTKDDEGNCTSGHFTGGPFYGPFGVTGTENSRPDDASHREEQVSEAFEHAVAAADGDKFESRHHFAAYGKSLCLSCHQRSSLMLNPDSNGLPGVQAKSVDGVAPDQFLELCSTWTAMSDGIGDNFQDTATAPKCQRCHMEPLKGKTVLHQWDQPDKLFTLADNPKLTRHFLPRSDGGTVGPVAERYLNNHAFMGANTADFGTVKIKSGFKTRMKAELREDDDKRKRKGSGRDDDDDDNLTLVVKTSLINKTAHMFPGAHPIRRFMTRVVVRDANGNFIPYTSAIGKSKFKDVTNKVATLEGDKIMPGFKRVKVDYNKHRDLVIQGQTPNLDGKGEAVYSQYMDMSKVSWASADATVFDCADEKMQKRATPSDDDGDGKWKFEGCTTVKKITDIMGPEKHFTRLYGRETGKYNPDGKHVVRPGFDSNIATDNRLEPNEQEKYSISYDIDDEAVAWPLTVEYRAYYLRKGASGKYPVGDDLFFESSKAAQDPVKKKKLAIFQVFSETAVIEED